MSSRTESRRNKTQPAPMPDKPKRGALLSAAIAILAVIGIIVYAWWRSHSAVPGAAVATSTPTFPPLAAVGSKAPPLDLKAPLDTITTQTLAGKPYLLEIFATWCPHCQRMTQVLRALRAQFPDSKLAMISVTGSPYARDSTPDNMISENQQDVDEFDRQFQVTWPTIFDPDLTVARTWGLDGFPTIYVVTAKGVVVYSSSGEMPLAVLVKAVRKAGA